MDTAVATLTSPVILFFILGLGAAFARSELSIPEAIAKGLSIYLMIAIGLKGGIEVSKSGLTAELIIAAVAGILLSFAIPFFAYALLSKVGRLDRVNAAAVSAHYGSVSVVTFVTALEILSRGDLRPAGYMVAVLALMETPAIISPLAGAAWTDKLRQQWQPSDARGAAERLCRPSDRKLRHRPCRRKGRLRTDCTGL
jgi:hypothetical protein